MKPSIALVAIVLSACAPATALAQANPLRGTQPSGRAAGPDQPVQPRTPVLVPRVRQTVGEMAPVQPQTAQPAQPQPPKPPFTLTPQEEAQVDRALSQWEQRNRTVKTFDCRFTRWIYDFVFHPPEPNKQPVPAHTEMGVIKYAAPDRGMFRIEKTLKDGKEVPVDDSRAEHWISDGKSIFELNPSKKQLIEHKLPPELQGRAIADSPLPFLFGADAQKLKNRYFIRVVPQASPDEILLEAYPRFQQDAANFHHAQFIIKAEGMTPYALKLVQPNEKDYTAYQFFEIVINDPLRLFKGDPFRPFTPLGWKKIVEEAPVAAQANRPGDGDKR